MIILYTTMNDYMYNIELLISSSFQHDDPQQESKYNKSQPPPEKSTDKNTNAASFYCI